MAVKLVYVQGGMMHAGEKTAERLIATGLWRRAGEPQKTAEKPVEQSEEAPQGDDTPEDAPKLPEPSEVQEERPDANVVRAWAFENDVEVSKKGRVAQQVYDAYAEAHKE